MKRIINKIKEITFIKKITAFFKRKRVRKALSILNKIKNFICWCVFIFLVFFVVILFIMKINGTTPSVMGYSLLRVTTGSMEPELMVGDLILSKEVDDAYTIKKDDVITYIGEGVTEGKLITHKVIVAPHKTDTGQIVLQTQGVANNAADSEITFDKVYGIMVTKVPILPYLYNMFLSVWGFIIFAVVILLVFLDELINIIKILTGYDRPLARESIYDIIERLKKEEEEQKLRELEEKEQASLSENTENSPETEDDTAEEAFEKSKDIKE